jgi:N-glycosylase/DNA lyase
MTNKIQKGTISVPCGTGDAFDLSRTVESGQTFCWQQDKGDRELFDDSEASTYVTVVQRTESPTGQAEVVRVSQPSRDQLTWEARFDVESLIERRFRLDDDLEEIKNSLPSDPVLEKVFQSEWGLRVPNDPFFPTLIAFICSSAKTIPHIHTLQKDLAERYGERVRFDGNEYYAFPTPAELADASEHELRELSLGFRAPYVQETAEMVYRKEEESSTLASLSYEQAHEKLKEFPGVGDKVADCVQLYALDYLNAFPVDTWMESIIEEHYPALNRVSKEATADAAREYFGECAGYAQSYLFTHQGVE